MNSKGIKVTASDLWRMERVANELESQFDEFYSALFDLRDALDHIRKAGWKGTRLVNFIDDVKTEMKRVESSSKTADKMLWDAEKRFQQQRGLVPPTWGVKAKGKGKASAGGRS